MTANNHDDRLRDAMKMVEALLMNGDVTEAVSLLKRVRIEFPTWCGAGPDLFDGALARDPADDLLYEVRSWIYRRADMTGHTARDLVRALLVAGGHERACELLDALAALENVKLRPWMKKAVMACAARGFGDRARERRLLLEAIRNAPCEVALFAALARCEHGTFSEIEIFALRGCVRTAPLWKAALEELHEVAEAVGDEWALTTRQESPRRLREAIEAGEDTDVEVAMPERDEDDDELGRQAG